MFCNVRNKLDSILAHPSVTPLAHKFVTLKPKCTCASQEVYISPSQQCLERDINLCHGGNAVCEMPVVGPVEGIADTASEPGSEPHCSVSQHLCVASAFPWQKPSISQTRLAGATICSPTHLSQTVFRQQTPTTVKQAPRRIWLLFPPELTRGEQVAQLLLLQLTSNTFPPRLTLGSPFLGSSGPRVRLASPSLSGKVGRGL